MPVRPPSPLGRCFTGQKDTPTERVIKLEKGYFLLLAFFFTLAAFFLKKILDRFLIIFKTNVSVQPCMLSWVAAVPSQGQYVVASP